MLHHISIGTADIVRAARFYDETLGLLGYKRIMSFLPKAVAYGVDTPVFWVQQPREGEARAGNGAHIAFIARDRKAVDAFHDKAIEMGGHDNGAPGLRPDYGPDYYGAFVIDVDGNRIEVVVAPKSSASKKRAPSAARKPAKSKTSPARKAKPAAKRSAPKRASGKRLAAKPPGSARKSAGRKSAPRRPATRTRRR